jgi:MraZ protein
MFMGEFRHSLDSKNRIIIPAKFRDELGSTFVVTKGLDGCLTVYTSQQWEGVMKQLEQLPATKHETRMYIRSLTANAAECEFDSQGRIQLPSNLVRQAEIAKQCVIIGAADHVEIWAEERWDKYSEEASGSFEDIAESLTEFLK